MGQIAGTNVAQSVAGMQQQERIAAREAERKRETRREQRLGDEVEIEHVQAIDAARSAKGNEHEETREDRQEHNAYTPGNADSSKPRRIDVEG